MGTVAEAAAWGVLNYGQLLKEDGAYLGDEARGRYGDAALAALSAGISSGGSLQLAGRLGVRSDDPLGAVQELAMQHAVAEALALGPAGGPLGGRLAMVWPGAVLGVIGMMKQLQRRGAWRADWPSVREVREALAW